MYSTSSPIDLTTVSQVKSWRSSDGSVPAANADDGNVQLCISAASLEWLRLTGRGPQNWSAATQSPFVQSVTYSETYDGNGKSILFLRNAPILSITSLVIGTQTVLPSSGYGSAGYAISGDGKSIIIRAGGGGTSFASLSSFYPTGGGQCFTKGRQNIAITYVAGFAAQQIVGELQTIPATGTPQLTVNATPWLSDNGVSFFVGGTPLVKVLIAPTTGQYFVQGGGGYLFAAADASRQVLLNYNASGCPADVVLAVTQMCAQNIVRRKTIDRASDSMAGNAGTTSYRSWWVAPEVERVITLYKRTAVC